MARVLRRNGVQVGKSDPPGFRVAAPRRRTQPTAAPVHSAATRSARSSSTRSSRMLLGP